MAVIVKKQSVYHCRFLECSFIAIHYLLPLPPYLPCVSLAFENHKSLVYLFNFVLSKKLNHCLSHILHLPQHIPPGLNLAQSTSGCSCHSHSTLSFSVWALKKTAYLPCPLTCSASTSVHHSHSTRLLWLRLGKWLHPDLPCPLACSTSVPVHHSHPMQSPSPGPGKWPSHLSSSAIGLWSLAP